MVFVCFFSYEVVVSSPRSVGFDMFMSFAGGRPNRHQINLFVVVDIILI